jgi:hypothetical protein
VLLHPCPLNARQLRGVEGTFRGAVSSDYLADSKILAFIWIWCRLSFSSVAPSLKNESTHFVSLYE